MCRRVRVAVDTGQPVNPYAVACRVVVVRFLPRLPRASSRPRHKWWWWWWWWWFPQRTSGHSPSQRVCSFVALQRSAAAPRSTAARSSACPTAARPGWITAAAAALPATARLLAPRAALSAPVTPPSTLIAHDGVDATTPLRAREQPARRSSRAGPARQSCECNAMACNVQARRSSRAGQRDSRVM